MSNCLNRRVQLTKKLTCANSVCLKEGVHLSYLCHKRAIRIEPVRANTGFFDTSAERFRAGLVVGKWLISEWNQQDRPTASSQTLNQ